VAKEKKVNFTLTADLIRRINKVAALRRGTKVGVIRQALEIGLTELEK
jgi:hypothetical protein